MVVVVVVVVDDDNISCLSFFQEDETKKILVHLVRQEQEREVGVNYLCVSWVFLNMFGVFVAPLLELVIGSNLIPPVVDEIVNKVL